MEKTVSAGLNTKAVTIAPVNILTEVKAKQKRHALLILGFPNKTILVHHEDTKAESNFLLAK